MEHFLSSVPDVYIVDIDNTAEPYWLHMVAHNYVLNEMFDFFSWRNAWFEITWKGETFFWITRWFCFLEFLSKNKLVSEI